MSRRTFLRSLLGVSALLPLTRTARAARATPFLIQQSPLAGFQYHAGESLWGQLREGDALQLVRESANPYDPRAVRVDWRGQKLGYVPRMENAAVAQMLDRGERLTARVERLQLSTNPWERVRLAVELETG
jgi:hypothetical protein